MISKKIIVIVIIYMMTLPTLSLVEAENPIIYNENECDDETCKVIDVFIVGLIKNLNESEYITKFDAVAVFEFGIGYGFGLSGGNREIECFGGILKNNFIMGRYAYFPGGW